MHKKNVNKNTRTFLHSEKKTPKNTVIYAYVGFSLIVIMVLVWVARQVFGSFLFEPFQRFNLGMWGKRSMILSYNKNNPNHTIILFSNQFEIEIPGGLKGYHVGSLGKLVSLEKKPLIFKKSLSSAGNLLIHKILYEKSEDVYFDDFGDISDEQAVRSMLMNFLTQSGELNLFERAYLFLNLNSIIGPQTSWIIVSHQKPQEIFYEREFRNERKLVQLIYKNSPETAQIFATMLENTGIRIADTASLLDQSSRKYAQIKNCLIIESEATSKTGKFLANYFGCDIKKDETDLYDIKMILGEKLEGEWGSE
jgi:hypothetical protein